jgi:hypothetical protein
MSVAAHEAAAGDGMDRALQGTDAPPPEYTKVIDSSEDSAGPHARRDATWLLRKQQYGLGWATDLPR